MSIPGLWKRCIYCDKPVDGPSMIHGTVWAFYEKPSRYEPLHIACLLKSVDRANELMEKLNK